MAHNYREDVPCHRVIKADGTLGQYNRGGILKKQEILTAEKLL
jgi:O6-methylguanine-DNA--protein-cysteine methyltransferase